MTFRKISLTFLFITMSVACAHAKKKEPKYQLAHQLTPEQAALVEKAIGQEKVLVKNIQLRTPLVETYIQNTRPDQKLYEVPVDDEYTLSRVDFGKGFVDKTYSPRGKESGKHGFFKGSFEAMAGLTRALGLQRFTYNPVGFMQMMFLDPTSFDQQHYVFSYVRREFLGSIRTWVYDVHPKVPGMGRFYGRIWIEDQDGNIVRFNGTYTGPTSDDDSRFYFHFDSWRMNMQPNLWLPVAVYVEETERPGTNKAIGLRAQTHFWGYSLKLPTRDSENVSVKVDDAVDKSQDSQDVGPLQASRAWVTQAENNVIDRLEEAGLVAPLTPGGYENAVLDQIVTNLVVPNNLALSDPVHCRVLLSTTLEATTVGNTILISKGLLDTMPNEESFASVIAMELAHVALGHHIDTRYAFNDRLMFPDESSFQRINMYHSDADNASAAKQAMAYLQNSMYKDRLPNAGLYYAELVSREKELKALNTPKLGDSLLKADGTPWMAELQRMAPKLNWDDLTQRAALPLGSWLKTDPWDDKVHMLNAKVYAYLNPRDKMPFEVTPVFYKLQRYDVANLNAPPVPGSNAAPAQPATADPPAANAPAAQPAADNPAPPAANVPAAQPAAADPAAPATNAPSTQPATGDQPATPPDNPPPPPPAAQPAPTQ
jgi:Peptidase family M48